MAKAIGIRIHLWIFCQHLHSLGTESCPHIDEHRCLTLHLLLLLITQDPEGDFGGCM